MRTLLAFVSTFVAMLPAQAQTDTERRVISNAVYLLRSAAYKPQNKLTVISADRAVLTDGANQKPVAIMQTEKCVFEMRERDSYGYKIDFNNLSNQYAEKYEPAPGRMDVKLVVLGKDRAACRLQDTGRKVFESCAPYLRFNLSPKEFETLQAAVSFIQENGCPPTDPPKARPPF